MNLVSSGRIKTRKSHHCWGCAKEFPAGSEMAQVTSTDMGKIFTVYWCNPCSDYMADHHDDFDSNGIAYGEIVNCDDYPKLAEEVK